MFFQREAQPPGRVQGVKAVVLVLREADLLRLLVANWCVLFLGRFSLLQVVNFFQPLDVLQGQEGYFLFALQVFGPLVEIPQMVDDIPYNVRSGGLL